MFRLPRDIRILPMLLISLFMMAAARSQPTTRPNIIFILADDLGYADVACFGSKYYETPNIDRLAQQGMRFTNGYTCGPNCAPTRAALMTGQYEPRTGIYTVGSIDRFDWQSRPLRPVDNIENLSLDKVIIAQLLKEAGYATAMFGKWHLGNGGAFHPAKRGFDEALVTAGKHFDFETVPPTAYPKGQYLADFLTDRAVDFIKRHKDGPFFLYLPHFGVHAPYEAKPDLIAKFKSKAPAGGQGNPAYAAMIYSVDESVGRIMNTLDQLQLAENTLLIFSSDNGGVGGYRREGIMNAHDVTDNAPLRGGKGMLYEGGVRVPFIFRWKNHIQEATSSDEPIISVDLYPTFLEIAGAQRPRDHALDGTSLLALLTNTRSNLDRALYWHFPGYLGAGANGWRTTPAGAIREGDFKLIEFFEDHRIELYNLKTDIGQQHDLAAEQPERAGKLRDKLSEWRKELNAKMPGPNDPKAHPAQKKKPKAAEEE